MVRAVDVLESLELLGSSQWGLVTTTQASEAGVSKMRLSRLADQGTVQRLRHGVYALPSADTGPLQGLRAAWLATGSQPAGNQPLAVVSGESAAAVHGLGDVLPSKYEFTTAVRRQTTQPDIRYRKRDLSDGEVTRVNGVPVTTVARTVHDLATSGTDFDHLATVVRDAVTATDHASADLVQALEPAAQRFGAPDGNALFLAALKAAGYRPDTRALELVVPNLQENLLQALKPQLNNIISQALAEHFRQAVPNFDVSAIAEDLVLPPVTHDVLRAALPHNEAIDRAFTHRPADEPPGLRKPAARKHNTPDAVRPQNRKADNGATTDPAGSKPPEAVPGSQAGQGGHAPRRRG